MFKFEITYVNEKKSKEVLTEETNESKEILDDGTGSGVTGYEKTEEQLKKAKYKLVKIAGFVLSAGLIVVAGDKVYDNQMEKIVSEDTLGHEENGETVYDKEDVNNLYYIEVITEDGYLDFYVMKELNLDDYASYNSKTNKMITNCEYYLGTDYYKNDYNKKEAKEGKVKLYVAVGDDSVVSVVHFPEANKSIMDYRDNTGVFNVDNELTVDRCIITGIGSYSESVERYNSKKYDVSDSELLSDLDNFKNVDGYKRTKIDAEKSR